MNTYRIVNGQLELLHKVLLNASITILVYLKLPQQITNELYTFIVSLQTVIEEAPRAMASYQVFVLNVGTIKYATFINRIYANRDDYLSVLVEF